MAGKSPGFDAKAFRTAIRGVWDMAAPNLPGEQATFFMPQQAVFTAPTDEDDVPFDPAARPDTASPNPPIKISCGVQYFDAAGNLTDFGYVVPARATIDMFDEDYAKVKGCAFVVLRGEKFNYDHTEFPAGLFDVTIYTLHFIAENAGGS